MKYLFGAVAVYWIVRLADTATRHEYEIHDLKDRLNRMERKQRMGE